MEERRKDNRSKIQSRLKIKRLDKTEAEVDIETRTMESIVKVTEEVKPAPSFDNSAYLARVNALKK